LQHNYHWFSRLTYVLLLHYLGEICSTVRQHTAGIRRSSYYTVMFIPPDLWLLNSPVLNPVDYRLSWGRYSIVCIRRHFETWPNWHSLQSIV